MFGYVFFTAIGLLLIIEGAFPFLAPKVWREMVTRMAKQNDRSLHIFGLVLMLIGVGVLYITHHFM